MKFVTPICNYDDIETIQELVRKLRGAGARVNSRYSLDCHINETSHNPETLRNIVTEISKEKNLQSFSENRSVAKEGGEVARNARKYIEKRTGKSVITSKKCY